MRWPIRHQILLPFVTVVLLAVTALTVLAAMLAARRSEQQTLVRLQDTIDTLENTNFPYTAAVLQKIRGLSGAHFLGIDAAGLVVASTLPSDLPLPANLAAAPIRSEISSLATQPPVVLDGARYFAARLKPSGNASVHSLVVLYPVERWSRDQWDAALLPPMVGGPALVLTSFVALWLAQRFSSRLRRLQAQVASIAAGDFREISPGDRQDEIQDLVASVNRMAARLSQMQHTIRQSERTRLLAQLAGGLAHQLRNAVAGARLALQLHQRRCVPAPGDESLSVALRQLSLTETQVRGMLSLGRSERRPAVPCDLGLLAAEIGPLLEPACEHVGVMLSIEGPDDAELTVLADVEALRAAIINLALNAIEAAGPRGSVSIQSARNDGHVTIDVIDTGPGPAPEIADALFDPFVTGRPEGVGLGLALARQVALDQGGALAWFRRDERTIFRLTLPALDPTTNGRETDNGWPVKSEVQNRKSKIPT